MLCLQARDHWAGGRCGFALRDALAAHRGNPNNLEAKLLLAALIAEFPASVEPTTRPELFALLRDPDIAPEYLCVAGWLLLMRDPGWTPAMTELECTRLAAWLQGEELASALLCETPVAYSETELVLTRLRRWLLLSGAWQRHPRLVHDFAAQAILNGGAWPFGDDEREALADDSVAPMRPAYLPRADAGPVDKTDFEDSVTRAVAQDYERWPYPAWRRLMAIEATKRLPDEIRALDPGSPQTLPARAKILIAGCGTGSEAAQVAREYPDCAVTAIDISRMSLAYAEHQCAATGVRAIRFVHLDLHKVAELQETFDAIFCSGVLHHLADPERGWAALVPVLRPGGVMRIMLYSCLARRWLAEVRATIRDLAAEPRSDDLIRRVRQHFLERAGDPVARQVVRCSPFATLSGTHDLLLHRREDCFDVPRISRALARLRLRLLTFVIGTPEMRARYDAMFPNDRSRRSIENWHMFERQNPDAFMSQYAFWCRKDAR